MNDQLREDIKTALNECGRWDNPDIMTEMTNAILPIIARAEEKARAGQREAERAKALVDAVEWARSCSGEAADAAADYIEEMADSETKKKRWLRRIEKPSLRRTPLLCLHDDHSPTTTADFARKQNTHLTR